MIATRENGFYLAIECNNCGAEGFRLTAIVLHRKLGVVCDGCWTALNSLINIADDNPIRAKAYWN